MAELADALDLGSSAIRCGGSTPFICTILCVSDSMVECHLAKVEVAGSSPVSRSIKTKEKNEYAGVAQW